MGVVDLNPLLFNDIKFNKHKLYCGCDEISVTRLSGIFGASPEACAKLLEQFRSTAQKGASELQSAGIWNLHKSATLAFIGDSITSDRESYFNIIKQVYAENPHMKFVDASVSGDKSDDALMKLYERTLRYKPDWAHILIGTNDMRRNDDAYGKTCLSLNEFSRNLSCLIDTLKHTCVHVAVSTISPVLSHKLKSAFPIDNWTYRDEDIEACNNAIAAIAEEKAIKLNDMRSIYARYAPADILMEDGLHLNFTGQKLLAERVLFTLNEFLSDNAEGE